MNESGPRRLPPDQSSGSGHTLGPARQPYTNLMDAIPSKRVCFYKSGDQKFNGLRMVINSRTFKSFDALLDSLSKKVPLPFGVRNVTTPRGLHAIHAIEELEDGKSYICSDTRKVKPINLLLARRKLPPWYNTRPASPRRRAAQQAKAAAARTPKRLVVFRNGDPSVRHAVLLQKRSTPTFQSLLDYVSELMQFHVVKLHTSDGIRVDSLPALILCSGTVVAAGREPFKPGNYNALKSLAPTWPPTNQMSSRRLRKVHRKKKSVTSASKSRNFSASSERYFVNQMQNSISGSYCDFPSNHTNSVELEEGQILESLAETDNSRGNATAGKSSCLPTDDDIEKSFRVNQDGSMTVEMRVRLTLKEEETIHWSTTLTRSSMANQHVTNNLMASEEQTQAEQEKTSSEAKDLTAFIDTVKRNKSKDNDDEDPPFLGNGIASEDETEVDISKTQKADVGLRRTTPGPRKLSKKQASVGSIKSVTAKDIWPDDGQVTEQYHMGKQSSSRPVPKPRQLGSVEVSNRTHDDQTDLHASGIAEIRQIQDGTQEATENVLHIFEQQTCQENVHANGHFYAHGVSMYGVHYSRPVTSDSAGLTPSSGFDSEFLRHSTASESISMWRPDNMSSVWRSLLQNKGKDHLDSHQKSVNKAEIIPSKPKCIKKHKKRQNKGTTDAPQKCKKEKKYSSARHLKSIYGYQPKTAMSVVKLKKKQANKLNGDDTTKISVPHDTLKYANKEGSENINDVSPPELTQSNGVLRQQNSIHHYKNEENLCGDKPNLSLCEITLSNTVINKYVGLFGKANPQSVYPNEETRKVKEVNQMVMDAALGTSKVHFDVKMREEESRALEGENYTQLCSTDQNMSVKDSLVGQKVKDRIRALEKTLQPGPSVQQTVNAESAMTDEAFIINPLNKANENTQISSEMTISVPEMKISVQKTTSSASVDKPAAQNPLEKKQTAGDKHCLSDTHSPASSSLYRLSSSSSLMSEDRPLSISPMSDHVSTATEQTVEQATSAQANMASTTGKEALARNTSVKRARLVSNLSFERKMSLRKASVEKNTSTENTSLEHTIASSISAIENTTLSSMEMQTYENMIEETPRPNNAIDVDSLASSHSYCMSASPIGLPSEERASSPSLSSNEQPSSIKQIKKNTIPLHFTTQSKISSSKPAMKKVKLVNDVSLENKHSSRKASTKKTELSDGIRTEKIPVSSRTSIQRTQLQRDNSLRSTSSHYTDTTSSPNSERRKADAQHSNSSPEMPRKAILQKRPSPYSQSLDVMSPSMKPKSKKQSISKNLSLDNTPEAISPTLKKMATRRKKERHQLSLLRKEQPVPHDSTIPTSIPCNSDLNRNYNTDAKTEQAKQESFSEAHIFSQGNQPSIKPVLEKICYSIKSIRQLTQKKHPSCLEKSNSMPDFSGHVASTFGSSSKVFLAFLAVMTLKEGITNLNRQELNANNVSCAEALKMIDSLKEIASIEDSDKLKTSLSELQKSASAQLLQTWRHFQTLSEKCKSQSPSPNYSEKTLKSQGSIEENRDIEENAFDEIINEFDIPEKLKEELASLNISKTTKRKDEGMTDFSISENIELTWEETAKANFTYMPMEQAVQSNQPTHTDTAVQSTIKQFTNTYPHEESNVIKYLPEDGQHHNSEPLCLQSCFEMENKENTMESKKLECVHRDISDHNTSQIRNIETKVDTERGSEESFSSKREQPDMPLHENTEEGMSVSEDDNTNDASQDDNQPRSNTYVALDESTEKSISSPDATELFNSEKEMCNRVCHPEEEGSEQKSDKNVGPNVRTKERLCSLDAEELSSSENFKCSELECNKNPVLISTSGCNAEGQGNIHNLMGLNVSSEESISGPDVAEQATLKEDQMTEQSQLKSISLSGLKEDLGSLLEQENKTNSQRGMEESKHLIKIQTRNENSKNLTEKDGASLEEDLQILNSHYNSQNIRRNDLTENQDSHKAKYQRDMTEQPKHYSYNVDEDSGNDVRSCGEQGDELEHLKAEDRHSSSTEAEFSTEKDDNRSPTTDKKGKQSKAVKELTCQYEETRLQSVAERIRSLERKAAGTHQRRNTVETSTIGQLAKTTPVTPTVSDAGDVTSETHKSHSAPCTRSAPQSSLSFSYDSGGIVTRESESNRVKTIKEMFQAKSVADIPQGLRGFSIPSTSDLLHVRPETSDSGGYQTQASSELSGGEDDSSWKAITKGFVKRTIERLYGKKDANIDEEAGQSTPSASKPKKPEASSILSHFQAASSRVISDVSYFSSTNTLDTLMEATPCTAFNTQVVPTDRIPNDQGVWVLRENTLMRKSISDPTGINKTCATSPQDEDTKEDAPYSLFSTKTDLEEKPGSTKCTYFSLHRASDSDVCQDDTSILSVSNTLCESGSESKDGSKESVIQEQKINKCPAFFSTGFKIVDNKVHPLRETPPDGEVVVVQPGKGHVVNRRPQETDVLDLIYTFCGQHCPIL